MCLLHLAMNLLLSSEPCYHFQYDKHLQQDGSFFCNVTKAAPASKSTAKTADANMGGIALAILVLVVSAAGLIATARRKSEQR